MMEKRKVLMQDMDALRKILLLEPRGYPCQNADIIFPSAVEGVDFGFVILEQARTCRPPGLSVSGPSDWTAIRFM